MSYEELVSLSEELSIKYMESEITLDELKELNWIYRHLSYLIKIDILNEGDE